MYVCMTTFLLLFILTGAIECSAYVSLKEKNTIKMFESKKYSVLKPIQNPFGTWGVSNITRAGNSFNGRTISKVRVVHMTRSKENTSLHHH
jgi:hypothetical protein